MRLEFPGDNRGPPEKEKIRILKNLQQFTSLRVLSIGGEELKGGELFAFKFPNLKRYGLEGGESMLPALDSLFAAAAQAGVQHVMLGQYVFSSEMIRDSNVIRYSHASQGSPQSTHRRFTIFSRGAFLQD